MTICGMSCCGNCGRPRLTKAEIEARAKPEAKAEKARLYAEFEKRQEAERAEGKKKWEVREARLKEVYAKKARMEMKGGIMLLI